MKVKLRNIINVQGAFASLMDQHPSIIDVKKRYSLSKDARKIEMEIKDFDNGRITLIKQYNINQNTLIASSEYQSFQLELDDLLDIEMELSIEPFLTETILTDERCTLKSNEMMLLDWLQINEDTLKNMEV